MNIPRTLTGRFVLVYLSFMWTVGTVVLMVVFGRENMAVVSTQVISKMLAIWRLLYCQ